MSLTGVRSYLRARSRELDLKEWKDGFNTNNIPETILNKSFQIDMSDVTQGIRRNQSDQEVSMPCTLKVFLKGYKNPADAIDSAVLIVENLVKKCCNPTTALTQGDGIKNVSFDSARYEPISDSNDNAVVATAVFRFLVTINVE
jgi:hypothetical protein